MSDIPKDPNDKEGVDISGGNHQEGDGSFVPLDDDAKSAVVDRTIELAIKQRKALLYGQLGYAALVATSSLILMELLSGLDKLSKIWYGVDSVGIVSTVILMGISLYNASPVLKDFWMRRNLGIHGVIERDKQLGEVADRLGRRRHKRGHENRI